MKKFFKNTKNTLLLICFMVFIQNCDKTPQQTCTSYDTDNFTGNYNISEICLQGFGHGVTFGTVYPGTQENEIQFANFLGSGQLALGYIACTNEDQSIYFRIPEQSLGGSAFTVVGEGYYYNTSGYVQLQFDIQTYEFGQTKNCSLTYSK